MVPLYFGFFPPAGNRLFRNFFRGQRKLRRKSCEKSLTEKIGYTFRNPDLFCEALTHKSFSNEQYGRGVPHNERLEFLGDAVLDLVVSQYIFHAFPDFPEGRLTRLRADVVSEKSLAAIGRTLDLGACLFLGKGEARSGGRDKDSLIADGLEALLGSIFCDGGLEEVRIIIESLFRDPIERAAQRKIGADYKTRLQENLQGRFGKPPRYALVQAEGPDHERTYSVEVSFEDRIIGRGQGRTKKAAEQEAACKALEELERLA